jgi:hypothetical protein
MGGVQGAARLQQCNFSTLDQIVGSTKAVVGPGVGAGGQEIVQEINRRKLGASPDCKPAIAPSFSVVANRRCARRRARSRFALHCLKPA